ncbi:MAG: DUF1475 family protein [Stagnimonas sp.]|nr:DUF1475 family protein [Stagnimonas sp.]
MKPGLAAFALAALFGLIGVSVWATGHQSIAVAISDLVANPASGNNPWLVATLFDAYFGFLWFWLWVAYKESGWLARGVWLMLILLLGNMAMAAYMLIQLWRLPPGASIEQLLLRHPSA